MNTRKMRMAALMLAAGLSGAAQAELQGRDLNGSTDSFEAYYDTVLDITWLADANYGAGSIYDDGGIHTDGQMTWGSANAWAANLSFTDGANVYNDWRLPTNNPINNTSFNYEWGPYGADYEQSLIGTSDLGFNITSPNSEMAYMFYVNLANPGLYAPTGAPSNCYVEFGLDTCLDNVGPFNNIRPDTYLSAQEYAPPSNLTWMFNMGDGQQGFNYKHVGGYAWAVSPGDVGVTAVPEAETWAMLLAGLGLVGAAARRKRQAEI